jgi:hypothetical protein
VAWHDAGADTINIQVNNGTVDSTTGVFGNSETFIIGGEKVGAGADFEFDGLIDEAGIRNRVLTTAERTELYNSGSGRTHPF